MLSSQRLIHPVVRHSLYRVGSPQSGAFFNHSPVHELEGAGRDRAARRLRDSSRDGDGRTVGYSRGADGERQSRGHVGG